MKLSGSVPGLGRHEDFPPQDLIVSFSSNELQLGETDPEVVKTAPHTAPVRRLDEAGAARNPNLRWRAAAGDWTPCPD